MLNTTEINTLDTYYKGCLEGLMKLYMKTPACVVYFLAGSLPASALMHLSMFSLFSMLVRLVDSPLARLARHCLTSSPLPPKSWFTVLNNLCALYELPSALTFLESPPPKAAMKTLVKKKVIDFWEKKLPFLPCHTLGLIFTPSHPLTPFGQQLAAPRTR